MKLMMVCTAAGLTLWLSSGTALSQLRGSSANNPSPRSSTNGPSPSTSQGSDAKSTEKSSFIVTPDYIIGPEDVLEITVWRNQDLSKQVAVRPDGRISLPLLGEVTAVGKTPAQLT